MGRTMVLYSRLVVLVSFSNFGQCGGSAVCCLCNFFNLLFSAELMVQCSAQAGVVFNCIEWGVIGK